jgi:hypothetical protein
MNINLSDRETQVCQVALKELMLIKSGSLSRPEDILQHFTNQQLNEFDLLASGHTLAAAMTALEKLTGKKIGTLLNPQQK